MTRWCVFTDGDVWCETSDWDEAQRHFGYALAEKPGSRVVLSEWVVPQAPTGHWLDHSVVVATGKNGLTRPSD